MAVCEAIHSPPPSTSLPVISCYVLTASPPRADFTVNSAHCNNHAFMRPPCSLTRLDPWLPADTYVGKPASTPYGKPQPVDQNDTTYLAEFASAVTLMPQVGCWMVGRWVDGAVGRQFPWAEAARAAAVAASDTPIIGGIFSPSTLRPVYTFPGVPCRAVRGALPFTPPCACPGCRPLLWTLARRRRKRSPG